MSAERILLPYSRGCFVCGCENPKGLQARSYKVGDRIELPFTPQPEHAGWNQVIHGGLVTTVLDEVMTWAAIVALRKACFAAEFTVRLRKPLSPGTPCVASAWVEQERRRVLNCAASLLGEDGREFATATGRYVAMPAEKMGTMEHDLVIEDGCWPVDGIFDNAAPRETDE